MSKQIKEQTVNDFEKVVTEKSIYLASLLRSQKLYEPMVLLRKKLIAQRLAGIKNYVEQMIDAYNDLAGEFHVNAKDIAMIGGLLNIYKDYAPFVAIVGKRPKTLSDMIQMILKQDFKTLDKKKIVILALPMLAFNKLMTKLNNIPEDKRFAIYDMMLDTNGVFAPTTVNKKRGEII